VAEGGGEAVALAGPPKRIDRPLESDEGKHIEKGDYAKQGAFKGGGHMAENRATLVDHNFPEVADADLPDLLARRALEAPYRRALRNWVKAQKDLNEWNNALTDLAANKDLRNQQGRLKNPNLVGEALAAQQKLVDNAELAVNHWIASNPRPALPGLRPLPENHGLQAGHQLDNSRYFFHQPLGNTGARIGGISPSSNPIHYDGHTWFPPGWDAQGILRILSSGDPRITIEKKDVVIEKKDVDILTKYTAWIRRDSGGKYEIAPSGLGDPAAAGYLKSSLLVTEATGQRTLFPEMNQ
jgi:hypothetical protein